MLALVVFAVLLCIVNGATPITVSANVRGKRYDVTASTVEEVTSAIESAAGLEASEQSVLFRGKVLNPTDLLEAVGVSAGDTLNIVKGRRARPSRPAEGADVSNAMEDMKFPEGMDAEKYKEAMGNLSPEDVQKASQAMDQLLDSEFIESYFSDEEKLEQARLDMLANLDKYDQAMPGFREQAQAMASDPVKWREAMENAKKQMMQLKEQRDQMRKNKGQQPPSAPPSNANSGVSDFAEEDEE